MAPDKLVAALETLTLKVDMLASEVSQSNKALAVLDVEMRNLKEDRTKLNKLSDEMAEMRGATKGVDRTKAVVFSLIALVVSAPGWLVAIERLLK